MCGTPSAWHVARARRTASGEQQARAASRCVGVDPEAQGDADRVSRRVEHPLQRDGGVDPTRHRDGRSTPAAAPGARRARQRAASASASRATAAQSLRVAGIDRSARQSARLRAAASSSEPALRALGAPRRRRGRGRAPERTEARASMRPSAAETELHADAVATRGSRPRPSPSGAVERAGASEVAGASITRGELALAARDERRDGHGAAGGPCPGPLRSPNVVRRAPSASDRATPIAASTLLGSLAGSRTPRRRRPRIPRRRAGRRACRPARPEQREAVAGKARGVRAPRSGTSGSIARSAAS